MMRVISTLLSLAACAALTAGLTGSALASEKGRVRSIEYRVSIPDVAAEKFKVTATLRNLDRDTLDFHFPIWAPGAYDIVNFGAYVQEFRATGKDGRALRVARIDTSSFRIVGGGSEIRLSYVVDDIENVPNSLWFGLSDIEEDYAAANATALFGYPEGYKEIPYTVTYDTPKGWDIAVGLDPVPGSGGTYHAADYDELVDAPLHMGEFHRYEQVIDGKPHIIAVHAPAAFDSADGAEVVAMVDTVVKIYSAFFGEMPYKRYVFQFFLVDPAPGDYIFGALEHRNSSTYRMPYAKGGLRESLLSVIAHEYWHLWSPKRIRVHQLGPFDYQSAPRTNSLWFAEGITEYYAQVMLLRHGLTKQSSMVNDLNQVLRGLYGREQTMSMSELSMNISEVDPAQSFALYSKGPVLAMLLDASIRLQTENRKSLDDAILHFNEEYGKKNRTFADEEIIPIIERVTGTKLQQFYDDYIVGRKPLPFDEYLPKIGIELVSTKETRIGFDAEFEEVEGGGWKLTGVKPGGSADAMGLRAGDVIADIRMNDDTRNVADFKIPVQYVDQLVRYLPEDVELGVMREGKRIGVGGKFIKQEVETRRVRVDRSASGLAMEIRKSMLGF